MQKRLGSETGPFNMKLLPRSAIGNCCDMLEGAESIFHLMASGKKKKYDIKFVIPMLSEKGTRLLHIACVLSPFHFLLTETAARVTARQEVLFPSLSSLETSSPLSVSKFV